MQQGNGQQCSEPMFSDFQRPEGSGAQPPQQAPGYSTSVYESPNVTATYKPYQDPGERKQEEQRRKFEDDAYLKKRQEEQRKRNRIIIAAICVAALFIILAVIGVIVLVVLTYEDPATLNGVNVSPDFDDLLWEVTGSVELVKEPYALEDIKITVSGSAVAQSVSKTLFECQWPTKDVDDPKVKLGVGSEMEFKFNAPMKATVKGSPKVSVGLSLDGAKVQTVEVDVSRYYSDGKI